jgi:predicted nucleic acid-binding protein
MPTRSPAKKTRRAPSEPAAIVILDATVPLNFARVDRVDLLGRVPTTLHVGRIVATNELRYWPASSRRAGEPFDIAAELRRRIRIVQMETDEELAMFARCREDLHLGRGESECVAIASERSFIVATDDGHARKILAKHGVRVKLTGTIGLLGMLEKARALVAAEVRTLVEAMKAGGGRLP